MSSKEKKDKTKKESKKEKKEKKEKTKKRDSKDLDASSNDFNQENEEVEAGSSSNTKSNKMFGVFRRSGRKSKSDKRGSKHGSSDSLKRLSVDSADLERRPSDVSFDEPTTSPQVSTQSTDVVTESGISKSKSYKPPEVKIDTAIHPVLVEQKEVDKPGVEPALKDDSLLRENDASEKLTKEILMKKKASSQETATEGQTIELSQTDKNKKELEEQYRREQTESEQLQDQEIARSEENSVNIVISNAGGMKIKTQTKIDAEKSVESTKKEQRSQKQDDLQGLPHINEDEVVSVHENKMAKETKGIQYAQDKAIIQTGDLVQSEITVQEEVMTEAEPVVLIQSQGGSTDEEQEAPANDEAMKLTYADQTEDNEQQEIGNSPITDEKVMPSLEVGKKKENQFQEQVEEFLRLDANIDPRLTPIAKNMEKDEKEEKRNTPYSPRRLDESSQTVIHETPPFDEKSPFMTSTPKRETSVKEQGKISEASENKVPVTSYGMTQFKQTSVMEFNLKVQIINNIKDAKISTKLLLAQLIEVNKRLHMLQEELLEIQKSGSNLDIQQ